jgi:dienelactone hydrolase
MWEGGQHAFMNRARPDAFDPIIFEAALKMTVDFFNSA